MSCGIRNSCEICHLGILKRLSQKQFEQTHFIAVSFQFFVISFHSKNLEYIGVTFFNGMYRYYLSKLVHKKIQELDLGVELLCKKRCLVTPLDIISLSFSFGYYQKVMYRGFYHGQLLTEEMFLINFLKFIAEFDHVPGDGGKSVLSEKINSRCPQAFRLEATFSTSK